MSSTGLKAQMKLDGSVIENIVKFVAELIGTTILVFLGCTGCVGSLSSSSPYMQIALSFGFAVTMAVTIFGHISGGHVNPCVTIAAVILGKTTFPTGGLYILGQCLGGLIGYELLRVANAYGTLCVNLLNGNITSLQAVTIEVLATWVLIMVCATVWDKRNEKLAGSVSILLGLTVAGLHLAIGPYTGCSINPARSLGPAIWTNHWRDHWVFWLGPILGSVFGCFTYLGFEKLMPGGEQSSGIN